LPAFFLPITDIHIDRQTSSQAALMFVPPERTTSTITDEKTMFTTTEEKPTTITQTDKLPAPAVADTATQTRLQRPRLPPRWEAFLFVQFAVARVTTPTLHFWISLAAITFITATILTIQRQPDEKCPIWRAAVKAWWVRPRPSEDNFWCILLARILSTGDIRWWWQMICFSILLPWAACVHWWPEVVGGEIF
jgi:hypothetical protein